MCPIARRRTNFLKAWVGSLAIPTEFVFTFFARHMLTTSISFDAFSALGALLEVILTEGLLNLFEFLPLSFLLFTNRLPLLELGTLRLICVERLHLTSATEIVTTSITHNPDFIFDPVPLRAVRCHA